MTIIFSNEKIEGLEGVYANPAYFDGYFDAGTDLVITENKHIAETAKLRGFKVKGFTKQPPKKVEATVEPKPSTDAKKKTVKRKPRVKKDS